MDINYMEAAMSYYEIISCRIAVQVCIGHFADGRERHRTFSIRGVNPDARPEAVASVIRALAPLLIHPITKVRKVIKREIIFYGEDAMPVPQDSELSVDTREARRIIPFSALLSAKRRAARLTLSNYCCRTQSPIRRNTVMPAFTLPRNITSGPARAPPLHKYTARAHVWRPNMRASLACKDAQKKNLNKPLSFTKGMPAGRGLHNFAEPSLLNYFKPQCLWPLIQ